MTRARALIPEGVNSVKASLRENTSGQLSEGSEAKTREVETVKSTRETGRGSGRERAFKRTASKPWETHPERRLVRQVPLGINNRPGMLGWESDGPVVAKKWSNVHGAKGPWLHTCQHQ